MAISVILATAGGGGATTVTLTGAAQNDLVVTCCGTVGGNTYDATTSGYTSVASLDGSGTKLRISAKRMSASPDASVDIGASAGAYAVYILRGVDTSTFEDAAAVTSDHFGSDYSSDAIVTVTDLAWALSFVVGGSNTTDPTGAPTGYSNYLLGNFSTPNTVSAATAWKSKTPAGSEDAGVFAGSPAAGSVLVASWAVRPAASAPAASTSWHGTRRRRSSYHA